MKQILAITVIGCLWYVFQQWPDADVHVIFCDVGQGDAVLVSSGFTQLLIDGGPDNKVIDCLSEQLPFWDKTIEFVLASHADKDHIGGLISVFDFYRVKNFIIRPTQKQTAEIQALQEKVSREQQRGLKLPDPEDGAQLIIGSKARAQIMIPEVGSPVSNLETLDTTETMLWAQKTNTSTLNMNENDRSIVLKLNVGTITYLFIGDIEIEAQTALQARGVIKDITVLKVSHHGAKNGTTPEFISLTQPEIAVISVGQKNPYGHPHPTILTLLSGVGAQVLRTDQLGTLETMTDGERVWYVR